MHTLAPGCRPLRVYTRATEKKTIGFPDLVELKKLCYFCQLKVEVKFTNSPSLCRTDKTEILEDDIYLSIICRNVEVLYTTRILITYTIR